MSKGAISLSIDVFNAVLCDEVRQEASGRSIVLGAAPIGPELDANAETTVARLAFYLEAGITDTTSIVFRLVAEGGDDVPLQVDMDLTGENSDEDVLSEHEMTVVGTIVFGKKDVTFSAPGFYILQYSEDASNWTDVRTFYFPPRQS